MELPLNFNFLAFTLLHLEAINNEVEFIDECPRNLPIVGCERNLCDLTECPLNPDAKCKLSLCGECRAVYFVNEEQVKCYSCE